MIIITTNIDQIVAILNDWLDADKWGFTANDIASLDTDTYLTATMTSTDQIITANALAGFILTVNSHTYTIESNTGSTGTTAITITVTTPFDPTDAGEEADITTTFTITGTATNYKAPSGSIWLERPNNPSYLIHEQYYLAHFKCASPEQREMTRLRLQRLDSRFGSGYNGSSTAGYPYNILVELLDEPGNDLYCRLMARWAVA